MKTKKEKPRRGDELITPAEFARRKGVARSTVHEAIKSKRLTLTKEKKLWWMQASEDWESNADLGQQRGKQKDEKWQEARTRREIAEADMAEIELKKQEGSIVSLDEAQKEFVMCSRLVRDRVLQIPKRLAPMLVGLNEKQTTIKLQDELVGALAALKEKILVA